MNRKGKPGDDAVSHDAQALIQELQTHQFELEAQNEELRRIQQELAAMRDRYQSLYDFSPIGYATLGQRGEIVEINLTGASLLGRERLYLIGASFAQFVHPDSLPLFRGFLAEKPSPGDERTCDLVLIPTPPRPLLVQLVGRIEAGEEGFVPNRRVAIVDITARKLAEDKLKEALCEAENANRAKSRFLAAASHDLRQPFQSMGLFLHLLQARLPDPATRDLADKLELALASGQMLLNALLDISTLDAGTVQANIMRLDVASLVERLVREYGPEAAGRGLALTGRTEPVWLYSDPVLLERMLRNLLVNALRYTSKGTITVRTRCRGDAVHLQVWDTGAGIPAEQFRLIFEEFHQLGNPERNAAKGLGLGLAVVERMARLLGVQVRVQSRVGRGSVFTVIIPRAPPRQPESEPPSRPDQQAPPAGSMPPGSMVVLIEDDPAQLRALEQVLAEAGYIVFAASDALEALACLSRAGRRPDIILTDLRLRHNQTGFEAIEQVRRRFASSIPAFVLTGETARDQLREGRNRGYRFLHKPIRPDQVIAALASALNGV